MMTLNTKAVGVHHIKAWARQNRRSARNYGYRDTRMIIRFDEAIHILPTGPEYRSL